MVGSASDFLTVIKHDAYQCYVLARNTRTLDLSNRDESYVIYRKCKISDSHLILFHQILKTDISPISQLYFCIFSKTSEVALAVYEHVPQGKVLRHTRHGVVDRAVAVRMVFA